MKHNEPLAHHHRVLERVNGLPRKILSVYDQHNVSEFVLYELCHEECFNLNKAAYFIDNPDFNCLKGVAGIGRHEKSVVQCKEHWQHPQEFAHVMQKSPFNCQVREVNQESIKHSGKEQEFVQQVAQKLGFKHPHVYTWDMKHDNYGVLVVEQENVGNGFHEDDFLNSLHVLSFCPIH